MAMCSSCKKATAAMANTLVMLEKIEKRGKELKLAIETLKTENDVLKAIVDEKNEAYQKVWEELQEAKGELAEEVVEHGWTKMELAKVNRKLRDKEAENE